MTNQTDDKMEDFTFITPPNGVDYDKADLDELMQKIQPLLEKPDCCAICTQNIDKNIEHLPPKCSGNIQPLNTVVIDEAKSRQIGELSFMEGDTVPYRSVRSLCPRCNERTGRFAGDYRDFMAVAEQALERIEVNSQGSVTFSGRPLAIAKQALSFFCSITGPAFCKHYPLVKELLLKKKHHCMPADFRLWLYLTDTPGGKQCGWGLVYCKELGHKHIVAEFTHKPLGWVLSWQSPAIDVLTEVTDWLDMEYALVSDFEVVVPKLQADSEFPLDYRSREEMERQASEHGKPSGRS